VPIEPDVNCEVSQWGAWGTCSEACGGGLQVRTRTVSLAPSGNGQQCPYLHEARHCNQQACAAAAEPSTKPSSSSPAPPPPPPLPSPEAEVCTVSDWSDWSPCSLTCGDAFGYTVRTRSVLSGTIGCPSLVDRNVCRPSCSSRTEGVVLAMQPEVAQSAVLSLPLVSLFPGLQQPDVFPAAAGVVSADVVGDALSSTPFVSLAPSPAAGDCLHSAWSDFGDCSRSCGGGVSIRTRSIVAPGLVCGPLADYRGCNGDACQSAPIITILN